MKQTIKSQALDFVAANGGKATWTEIQNFMVSLKGITPSYETRGWYSSYFSGHTQYSYSKKTGDYRRYYRKGVLLVPNKSDSRYLSFNEANNCYYLNTK